MKGSNSVSRVPDHTAPGVNEAILRKTKQSLKGYLNRTPAEIEHRLKQLDYEWDIERAIEANAATVLLGGVALATFVNKRWLALPAVVAGFLLQHAVQGWCPPVPILRRLGFRTPQEIEEERYALKLLKGDFDNVGSDKRQYLDAERLYEVVCH